MPYPPSEDSYLTLESIKSLDGSDLCVDVGTGSCILARELARKCRRVVAIDVDIDACRSCPEDVDVLCSDGAAPLRRADAVISNLPYLPPEEPLDTTVHDLGLVSKLLRWISAERPRVVVLTFSTLGRHDYIIEALEAFCAVVRVAKLHLFFESIITVTALCAQPRR
ncbi:MAG: protein-(glutamine-N5) methyltransferase [Pyrobaculum sp.]